MKLRSMLSASEVEALWTSLERQLEQTGLPSQPEVAGRVLSLVSSPHAHLREFVEIIKSDAPLAGRLLRFANSAFFAQRQPVTNLERACGLLGIERLKAISLGFFLSRAAASDPGQSLSRLVWGESVYRACIANELAKEVAPHHAPEAFVIGLMMDAGVPLMHKMLGEDYLRVLDECDTPAELYAAEFKRLPYTHVDVVVTLARRWKLPELLSRPLQRHHMPPRASGPGREPPSHLLHRIAYYVGSLSLSEAITERPLQPAEGDRVLGITQCSLQDAIRRAGDEYGAMTDVFREVADSLCGLTDIALSVQQQLVAITDEVILQQLRRPAPTSGRFSISGHQVEIEIDTAGRAVAYLSDAEGARLLSYSFVPGEQTARGVLEGLGLEAPPTRDAEDMDLYLRSVAA